MDAMPMWAWPSSFTTALSVKHRPTASLSPLSAAKNAAIGFDRFIDMRVSPSLNYAEAYLVRWHSRVRRCLQEPRPTTINRASRRFSGPGRYFTEGHERKCGHSFHRLGRRSTSPAPCECALEELDQRSIALHWDKGDHAHFLDRCLLCLLNELLFEVLPGVGD